MERMFWFQAAQYRVSGSEMNTIMTLWMMRHHMIQGGVAGFAGLVLFAWCKSIAAAWSMSCLALVATPRFAPFTGFEKSIYEF